MRLYIDQIACDGNCDFNSMNERIQQKFKRQALILYAKMANRKKFIFKNYGSEQSPCMGH